MTESYLGQPQNLFQSAKLPLPKKDVTNTFLTLFPDYTLADITVSKISTTLYTIVTNKDKKEEYEISVLGCASIAFTLLITKRGDKSFQSMVVKKSYDGIKKKLDNEHNKMKRTLNWEQQKEIFEEIYQKALEEISFQQERKNIEIFNTDQNGDNRFQVVQIHEKDGLLSNDAKNTFLILKQAPGVTLSAMMARFQKKVKNKISPTKIGAIKKAVETYTVNSFKRILEKRIAHGDAHKGNLMIDLNQGQITLTEIDLGSIVQLSEEELRAFKEKLNCIAICIQKIIPKIEKSSDTDFTRKVIPLVIDELKELGTTETYCEKRKGNMLKASDRTVDRELQYTFLRKEDEVNYTHYFIEYQMLRTFVAKSVGEAPIVQAALGKILNSLKILYALVDDWNNTSYNSDYEEKAMGKMKYPTFYSILSKEKEKS